MKKLIVLGAAMVAAALAGCAGKAPELLYADGRNRIPVTAARGAPAPPSPAAPVAPSPTSADAPGQK
jgi:hypothetical protein